MNHDRYRCAHRQAWEQLQSLRQIPHAQIGTHAHEIAHLLAGTAGMIRARLNADQVDAHPWSMPGLASAFAQFVQCWTEPRRLQARPRHFHRDALRILIALRASEVRDHPASWWPSEANESHDEAMPKPREWTHFIG